LPFKSFAQVILTLLLQVMLTPGQVVACCRLPESACSEGATATTCARRKEGYHFLRTAMASLGVLPNTCNLASHIRATKPSPASNSQNVGLRPVNPSSLCRLQDPKLGWAARETSHPSCGCQVEHEPAHTLKSGFQQPINRRSTDMELLGLRLLHRHPAKLMSDEVHHLLAPATLLPTSDVRTPNEYLGVKPAGM